MLALLTVHRALLTITALLTVHWPPLTVRSFFVEIVVEVA